MNHKICNIDYDNELNKKINKRYFPSTELQPNFDPRPISTKYAYFMTEDNKISNNVNLRNYNKFNTSSVFYTGDRKAPVQGSLQNVDIESLLNNRFMALQKNDQAFYIPSTKSDLYNNKFSLPTEMKEYYQYNKVIIHNVDKCNLAPEFFNNSTRYNLTNIK